MKKLANLLWALLLAAMPAPALAYLVEVYESGVAMTNIAQADALIALGSPTFSDTRSIIELDDLGDGTRGRFSINQPFPGGANDTFAVHVTGQFRVDITGFWTLFVNHDDGVRLTIDGVLLNQFPTPTDNRDTGGVRFLTAGMHSVDIVFFENSGGASLEFFGAPGIHTAFNPSFFLLVPEPGVLTLLALGLLGVGVHSRRSLRRRLES